MQIGHWTNVATCLAGLLISTNCSLVRRIVGGDILPAEAWPWLVSLNYRGHHSYLELQGLQHLCGGTLISELWVLTAAHCVHGTLSHPGLGEPKNWVAVLGEYNRGITEVTEQRTEVGGIFLKNFTTFPKLREDIALLKLKNPARITSSVRPLALDKDSMLSPGTSCKTAGWGQFTPDDYGQPQYGNGTMVPHVAEVRCVAKETCRKAYQGVPLLVDDKVVCFGSDLGHDTCKGDSGGPLVCSGLGGSPVVAGVISVGLGCAQSQYPGVYTRVSNYREWILWTMANY